MSAIKIYQRKDSYEKLAWQPDVILLLVCMTCSGLRALWKHSNEHIYYSIVNLVGLEKYWEEIE